MPTVLKVLYVAMKYDYGDPARGHSFEHTNFYSTLSEMGHELVYFDFMTLLRERGREEMNRLLRETAEGESPDLMFTVLFGDELEPAVVETISRETSTTTLNWFCDDHWRFETFSARWAPRFDWVVTTASSAVPKYARIGYRNAIKSQWACDETGYRKLDLPLAHDVSFVGQPHGNRRQVIAAIRAAGIDVHTRGYGWEDGRVSQEEMIRIFNQSRVNLNLPNAASRPLTRTRILRDRIVHKTATLPLGSYAIGAGLRALRLALRRDESHDLRAPSLPEQIKGRNFEVPGCGGFLLTGPADDLERYYEPGREIVVYSSVDDLIEKIRYYLAHEEERRAIADAGYERTLREHTYRRRFTEIFRTIGLPAESAGRVVRA